MSEEHMFKCAGVPLGKADDQFFQFYLSRLAYRTNSLALLMNNSVFCFEHTYYDARRVALKFFRDVDGYPLSYSQIEGTVLNEGKVTIEAGSIFLRENGSGEVEAFEVSRDTDREGARRGAGVWFWESVACKKRREVTLMVGGMQAHRQEADHRQERRRNKGAR